MLVQPTSPRAGTTEQKQARCRCIVGLLKAAHVPRCDALIDLT